MLYLCLKHSGGMFETFGPYVSNIGALGLNPVYVDLSRIMFGLFLFVWKFLNV